MFPLTNALTSYESSESFNETEECGVGENQATTFDSNIFWCGSYFKDLIGHWSVEFPGYQYVSGFSIKTINEKYLQQLIVAYGSNYKGVHYITNNDDHTLKVSSIAIEITDPLTLSFFGATR